MWVWRNVVAGGVVLVATACVDDFECGGTTSSPCTSSTDERTSEELGAAYCAHIRDSSCGTPELEAECLAEVEQHHADAARDSCETELYAYFRCSADSPIECSTIDTSPPTTRASPSDSNCSELGERFFECVYWIEGTCGLGSDADGSYCTVSCADFASSCQGSDPNGPVTCTCSEGPNTGLAFEAENCGRDLMYKTGHLCRY
jgi:hypothetical protein